MGLKAGWVIGWKIKVTLFENRSVFILIHAMHGLQLVFVRLTWIHIKNPKCLLLERKT